MAGKAYLADAHRLEVMAEPRRRASSTCCGKGAAGRRPGGELGVAQPNVSKHLRVLRDAGLVTVRPDGQRRWYRLRPEPLVELDAWLAPYRRLWTRRLDDLEAHLDEMED